MSFLDTIRRSTQERLASLPSGEPAPGATPPSFERALAGRQRLSVVAEVKRKSPSRGSLARGVDPVRQALAYERGGAAAISVLTEPHRFGGSFDDLRTVTSAVTVPVLMKDFVIAPDQVRVGAALGASAFLVVLRLVDDSALADLLDAGRHYGATPLLEAHDERDLERALAHDGIVGINNRDLDTLRIDRSTALRLATVLDRRTGPATRIVVAESGYTEPTLLTELHGRVDAALIGSALMTSPDPTLFLHEVRTCV